MVGIALGSGIGDAALGLALWAEASPLERLTPSQRVVVYAALMAILLLTVAAALGVRLGGRWARRLARHQPPPVDRGESDWDRKQPLEGVSRKRRSDGAHGSESGRYHAGEESETDLENDDPDDDREGDGPSARGR